MKKVSGSPLPLGVTYKNGRANFAMEVPEGKTCKLLLYRKGEASLLASYVFSDRIGSGCYMAVDGLKEEAYEYNYDIDGERVTDSYAKALSGKEVWFKNIEISEKSKENVRGIFYEDHYDWEADQSPRIQEEERIAYAIHVRGFTKDTHSKVKNKGTFQGIIEKIPYLKDLGINQIQCMPVYEFEEAGVRVNYWGYGPGYYFAPKSAYAKDGDGVKGLKDLVKYCHKAGIEVVLEMPFAEGISGLMVTDCLRNYVMEYHVDGFHLMGDGVHQKVLEQDPILYGTKKMFSEIAGNADTENMLAEYNAGFKQDMRRFLKSDEGMISGAEFHVQRNTGSFGTINYMANQDGFTLYDTVAYNYRHNEANGEDNRDGSEFNYSWNCGIEGATRKQAIRKMREQQMRNAFLMLLLSQGTPMIYGGDEFANSQAGNNNAWCQDNETGWVNWKKLRQNKELFEFVKEAVSIRKMHSILHLESELKGADYKAVGYPDISYHSNQPWYYSGSPQYRHIGILYCEDYAGCEKELLFAAYNFHWNEHEFGLPSLSEKMSWEQILTSGEDAEIETEILKEEKTEKNKKKKEIQRKKVTIKVGPRTVVILKGKQDEN